MLAEGFEHERKMSTLDAGTRHATHRVHNAPMHADTKPARPHPKAFMSYSWESDSHKGWVIQFATRLRGDGVDVTLDRWHVQPGDQLPAFMERAARENDYVLIICTPHYADRSNRRLGGVGYEGDIFTAEVLNTRNEKKFIPIFRAGQNWLAAAPTWLAGKYRIDLRGEPFSEDQYADLLTTLHGTRPLAPPMGSRPAASLVPVDAPPATRASKPVRILGILADEVSKPQNDGTRGSALYRIPFQLSRSPTRLWRDFFIEAWNHPSSLTSMHRPGIARVEGDRIILDGTTIEEVERTHRDTLVLALKEANRKLEEADAEAFEREDRERQRREEHSRSLRDAAKRITFD
jgi:hypothetical protein